MSDEKRWYLIYVEKGFYIEEIKKGNNTEYMDWREENRFSIPLLAKTDEEAVKEARGKLRYIKSPRSFLSSRSFVYVHVETGNYDLNLDTGEKFETSKEAKSREMFLMGDTLFKKG